MAVDCLLDRIIGQTANPLRCSECQEPLLPGQKIQFDHLHADVHGGPHDYRNLRPIHYDPCHKKKTKADVQANAKVKRIRGERKPKPKRAIPKRPTQWATGRKLQGRGFQKRAKS